MAKQIVNIHTLENGMTLVSETMQEVSSAAFVFLVPAGAAYDPAGLTGTSNVLAELLFRGAGEYDNRALNERLDGLGLHRQSSVAQLFWRGLGCEQFLVGVGIICRHSQATDIRGGAF